MATLNLEPIPKSRISDEAVVRLARLILEGQVLPGERLPAERDLADQLGITRTSLREALRRLESMRLIEVRPRDGIHVRDYLVEGGVELVLFLLEHGFNLDPPLIRALAEARRYYTRAIVELAARRAPEAELAALDERLSTYPWADEGLGPGEADFAVFARLAGLAGNRVFVSLLNSVRPVVAKMSLVYGKLHDDSATARAFYRDIVRAIRARDVAAALAVVDARMAEDDALIETLLGFLEGV